MGFTQINVFGILIWGYGRNIVEGDRDDLLRSLDPCIFLKQYGKVRKFHSRPELSSRKPKQLNNIPNHLALIPPCLHPSFLSRVYTDVLGRLCGCSLDVTLISE